MSPKRFHISAAQIRRLAPGRGRCFATDIITVDGQRVGYMYREEPSDRDDSGWRFFAGTEDEQYVNDPKNVEIYDVNTIANYDPEIIPLLDSPIGSAFERSAGSGSFVAAPLPEPES
jgi:hypothetical protein